jgi:RNA-binding protein
MPDNLMQDLKPTVWIGKQGCTETMIDEIITQLKKRRMIKVKWLQNTDVDPAAVAVQARARLVEVRGRTMVLADKGKAATGSPGTPANVPAKVTAKATASAAAKSRVPEKRVEKLPMKTPSKSPPKETGAAKPRETGMMKAAKK